MGKSTYKCLSLVLLLLLVSCGRSQPASTTEDSAGAENTGVTPAPTESPAEPATSTAAEPEKSSPAPSSAPVAVAKRDCGQMETQTDMNQCAADNYTISDKALNQVYQDVRQDLGDTAKARLTTAEERWIVFRDAQCAFERSRVEGGSMAPLIQASCMEQITDNRIAELQQTDRTELSYQAADAQLNQVYQEIRALISDAQKETLTDVQLSWLDYRDAHCEYETALSIDQNECLASIIETRVWQLEALRNELAL